MSRITATIIATAIAAALLLATWALDPDPTTDHHPTTDHGTGCAP